ncbi:Protein RRNAD1 [Larimichthys crocea]|uniref:Protein RRNAD1 n=1 Tax=Larimichthys crocea TaxID=215358 RepID=A0A6G0ICT3_LARCR|nr:Protein RRNAD1 [Larimichthys crocea]
MSGDVEMFTSSFTADQARHLSTRLSALLAQYGHLSDSYIIEFFTEDLWHTLPNSWQPVLQDLSYPQVADLLLDVKHEDRRYPSVWPLSLLAFRATAHALAFPRECRRDRGRTAGSVKPEEFLENQSQSSLLGHIFRKHVKPKKQHEIRRLGLLVKQLCEQTDCSRVVDVGSGQGHLTRFLSFGLGLSVTAIEADHNLVAMASRFDGQLLWALEKEKQKKSGSSLVPVSQSSPRHVAGWVNPKASWEAFITQLKTADCVNEDVVITSWLHRLRSLAGLRFDVATQFESESCCSCVQPVCQEDVRPEENSQRDYSDFVLTGLHACGDLSATLLRHFVNCPRARHHICGMLLHENPTKENPTPPLQDWWKCPSPAAPGQETLPSEFGYP